MDAILMRELLTVARRASQIILNYFGQSEGIEQKTDNSPVTLADRCAEELIIDQLRKIAPAIPCVGEESFAGDSAPIDQEVAEFFLVDPLDGTKEFIAGRPDFTVNIALIRQGAPILGVVMLPAADTIYYSDGNGRAARIIGHGEPMIIHCRLPQLNNLCAVASRSHRDPKTDHFIKSLGVTDIVAAGSSVKFCRIAEGAADIYPRFGRTMEWDTAAGHAVLLAAGGSVTSVNGTPLTYAKPKFENPAFIAWGTSMGPEAVAKLSHPTLHVS